MIKHEMVLVEDFTNALQFENCNAAGVPYILLKIGTRVFLHIMVDIQSNARIIIPNQCKKKDVVQGQCIATGNTSYEPNQPFYVLVNYEDGSLYFSAKNNSRITFSATWSV